MAKYSLFKQAPGQPVTITLPDWVEALVQWDQPYPDDNAKMTLAIELSKQNVLRGTGGPFGTAIFDRATNLLLGVGVNRVVPLSNSPCMAKPSPLCRPSRRWGISVWPRRPAVSCLPPASRALCVWVRCCGAASTGWFVPVWQLMRGLLVLTKARCLLSLTSICRMPVSKWCAVLCNLKPKRCWIITPVLVAGSITVVTPQLNVAA